VPARCGCPPLSWEELRPLVDAECTQVAMIGRACLHGLDHPPADWPLVRQIRQDECFHLVAGAALVDEAIARGAYLVTPGWLDDWRGSLRNMGFDEGGAAAFSVNPPASSCCWTPVSLPMPRASLRN
jgi:hypothetical protein